MCQEFYNEIDLLGIKTKRNVPLKNYSTFRIGGNADLLLFPKNESEIIGFFKIANKHGKQYVVLGNGSNVLFSDADINTPIICFGADFSGIEMIGDTMLKIKSGTPLSAVCLFAMEQGLSGMEFAYGIPGTFGGAIYMNAGAYDGEISKVLAFCRSIKPVGTIEERAASSLALSYRHSIFQESGDLILSGTIQLSKGNRTEINQKMQRFLNARVEKQPLNMPSCGSTFKRPVGSYASKLIEECGLKGYCIGGAQVSEKHAGFVVNTGCATCNDVLTLIKKVQEIVLEKTGFVLEEEIRILR